MGIRSIAEQGASRRLRPSRAQRRAVRHLQPWWRWEQWRGRSGGRRRRIVQRLVALTLIVGAGALAARPSAASPGIDVITLSRDVPLGTVLSVDDLRLQRVTAMPDGALTTMDTALGQRVSAPVRRGEVLTDVRLVDPRGPSPGPGRSAVAVRPADPAVVSLLQPGMTVRVLGVSGDGATTVLSEDALVLAVLDPLDDHDRAPPVLLSVAIGAADRVAAGTLTGDIALQFM